MLPSTAALGKEILPFSMGGKLPEHFQKKAEVELHDTPEMRAQSLRLLRELCEKDKHTRNWDTADEVLLHYLRVRKFDVWRAFVQVRAGAVLMRKNPDMFRDFCFEKTVRTQTDRMLTFLPWRCPEGCAIVLVQLNNWDPETFPPLEVKRAVLVYLFQSLREPMTQVNGVKAILDVRSNPTRHLKHATPKNLHLIYHGIQHCVPLRYKQVHILNKSLTFKAVWRIIRPFISAKIKKRIFVHDTTEALLNFFPKAILPKEYGGDLEDYDMTDWLRQVMSPEIINTMLPVPPPLET